jgi:hypothetical protein
MPRLCVRHTGRQAGRQADRQAGRQAGRQQQWCGGSWQGKGRHGQAQMHSADREQRWGEA